MNMLALFCALFCFYASFDRAFQERYLYAAAALMGTACWTYLAVTL